MTTVDDVIARVNTVIQREVGYTSRTDPNRPANALPGKWSKYDQNGWHGYWCARGISTCVMNAIGVEAGRAVIGQQRGMVVGWAATWLWLNWIKANSPGYPGVRNCRTGDIMMMRFPSPSGGRSKNPTNHVEWVTGRYSNGVPAIGFNSVGPGGSGEPTAGGTVARQHRTGYIVGTYRLDWARAAVILGKAEPVRPPTPKPVAPTLKPPAQFKPYGRTTEAVQALVGVTPDGDYGPRTHAAVKAHQADLTEAGYSLGAPDGLWGRSTHTAQEAYMSDITALRDEVRKLAIVVNRIDKDTRIGDAAGQIADRIDKAHQDVAARLEELNVLGAPAPIMVPLSAKGREALGTEMTVLTLPKAVELLLRHAYQTGNLLPVVDADVKGIASGIEAVAGPDAAKVEQIITDAATASLARYQATFTRIDPEES